MALTVGCLGVFTATGCGGDHAPGGPFGDDREQVIRVVRGYAVADAAGDEQARCDLSTTHMQQLYITDFEDHGRGPRDTDACAAALARLDRRATRTLGAREMARFRRRAKRVRDAARDEDHITVTFEDGHADVVVDAAAADLDDGHFRVERDGGRWRMGMYPETATLR